MTRRNRSVMAIAGLALALAACLPGTPDLVFSPTGSVPYGTFPGAGYTVELVARADGGVVATRSDARPLTRITANGAVDATWGSSLPDDCRNSSRAIATGAGVLFTCSHLLPPSGPEVWQMWRVTAAGGLDPAFGGGDGIVDVHPALRAFDVVPLPNGGYLGVGHSITVPSTTAAPPLFAFVYDAAGALLRATQIDVTVPSVPPSVENTPWTIGVELYPTPDGVAAVEVARTTVGAGFPLTLSRVQHFDATGQAIDDPPLTGPSGLGYEVIAGLTTLAGGREAETGTTTTLDPLTQQLETVYFLRVRLADGSPDPQFGTGGTVAMQEEGRALAATNGGRFLVVAGGSSGGAVVVRFDATTGALDPTFGTGGTFRVALRSVESVVERADYPQLYLGGYDTSDRPAVARVWNYIVS